LRKKLFARLISPVPRLFACKIWGWQCKGIIFKFGVERQGRKKVFKGQLAISQKRWELSGQGCYCSKHWYEVA